MSETATAHSSIVVRLADGVAAIEVDMKIGDAILCTTMMSPEAALMVAKSIEEKARFLIDQQTRPSPQLVPTRNRFGRRQ